MNKKAIIYARVSTDEQAEKGHSIRNQIEECRRYAERKGIQVVEEIKDDYSGATLDRPGFNVLQNILNEGLANVVIVLTADRLSRNFVDGVVLHADWKKAGIDLHYVDTGQAQNDMMGKFLNAFYYLKGESEREDIKKRTSMGRVRKARDGNRPVMSGYPPFGYKRIGRLQEAEMVINPEQAEIVRMMFRWYTSSENGGPLSLLGISNRLDKMGIRPKFASLWKSTSVRAILKNEIYIGKTYYQKTMIDNRGKQVPRPRDEWIEIDVPHLAIIDKQTFDQAQRRAKLNQLRARRNRRGKYLLTGHIQCGYCGYSMYGFRREEGANLFYRCAGYNNKGVDCQGTLRNISASKTDQMVWDWLCSLLEDETTLKRGISAMTKRRENELQPKKSRLDTIGDLVKRSNGKIRRLVDELFDFQEGPVREAVKEKIKIIEAEQKMLLVEKDRIESELAQMEISPEVENQVMETAAKVRERLPDRTFENMRYLLDRLNVNVVFKNETEELLLGVSCAIPGSDREIVFNSV